MNLHHRFTIKIILGMLLGIAGGLAMHYVHNAPWQLFLSDKLLATLGQLFIRMMKMLVVPIVFVSLVCGVCNLGGGKKLSVLAMQTIAWYLLTTLLAITLAISCAQMLGIGSGFALVGASYQASDMTLSLGQIVLNMVPTNPVEAMVDGNMMQVVVFAVMLGLAMIAVGEKAQRLTQFFQSANEVLMRLVLMIMALAPYGVFCLLFSLFAKMQLADVWQMVHYFNTVVLVLVMQLVIVYGVMLALVRRVNIMTFIGQVYPAMLFAFSTSSSNASIPVTLETVERRCGIPNRIASFVIPMGATINMDGTAIMQGVATVFLAHAYGIHIGLWGYASVVLLATVSSIGTAGVPGVGLFTLVMVLRQVHIPVDGIALIIGVDRILDMLRTAVNVAGDAMVARLVTPR